MDEEYCFCGCHRGTTDAWCCEHCKTPPRHMPNKPKEEEQWEKDFDTTNFPEMWAEDTYKAVKQFIRETRQQVREEMKSELLEKLKFDLFPVQIKMENPYYWKRYSDTVNEIKDIIKNL